LVGWSVGQLDDVTCELLAVAGVDAGVAGRTHLEDGLRVREEDDQQKS